jgi:hypothetical protein
MKRFDGSYVGAKPTWDYINRSGMWSQEQVYSAVSSSLWPGLNPVSSLNPLHWYDFADTATVSTTNGLIDTINDKGSRAMTLSRATLPGTNYGTWVNGLRAADFGSVNQNTYLRNTNPTDASFKEIYIVLDSNVGSTFSIERGLLSGTQNTDWALIGSVGTAGFLSITNNIDAAFINNSASNSYSSVLPAINSPCLMRLTRLSGTVLMSNGFQIGLDRNALTRGWIGLIGEVIVFGTGLGTTERNILQQYLAYKWSLTLV